MNLLSVEQLTKSYGDRLLFDKISFGVQQGMKAALIARNGAGKTTLLNILSGLDTADSGNVVFRKDTRIAFLHQEPVMQPNETIADYIFSNDLPQLKLIKQYEMLLDHDEHSAEEHLQLQELSNQITDMQAWDAEAKARQVLGNLNIHQLDKKLLHLSGGQRKRVALAKVILSEPDFLILDEPTNHLDIEMVEFLEEYLSQQHLSLLMVTHDRYFLDEVCNTIIELENQKLFTYEGNYEYFLEKKSEREINEQVETGKARNLLKTELEWMRRMPKARGTKSKARIDAFYELKDKAAGKKKQEAITLDVKMNRIGGKVLELKKVYKSFGELKITQGFDYNFKTGERIGIVGKNGCGKSTFLNMLIGAEPSDSGKINVGDTVVFGYYSQSGLELKEDKRVIEVVKEIADIIPLADGTKITASSFLNLFQFPPAMQHTFVSKLSGGERRRLHLLTVLIKNPNFLILDEPTNDLDLLTLSTLEEFLLNYKGCLLVVSHDRYFLNKLVDHLFVFEGEGKIKDYNGSYTEYRSEKQKLEQQQLKAELTRKNEEKLKDPDPKNTSEKRKLSFKEKFEYENIEKEIAELEKEKHNTELEMSSTTNHESLQKQADRLNEIIQLIDEKTLRWIELSEMS